MYTTIIRAANDPVAFVKALNDISKGHGLVTVDAVYQTLKKCNDSVSIHYTKKARIKQAIIDGWNPVFRRACPKFDWQRTAENVLLGYGYFLSYAAYDTKPEQPGKAFHALAHFIRAKDMTSAVACFTYHKSILVTYTPELAVRVACDYLGMAEMDGFAKDLLAKVECGDHREEMDITTAARNGSEAELESAISRSTDTPEKILYSCALQLSQYPEEDALYAFSRVYAKVTG